CLAALGSTYQKFVNHDLLANYMHAKQRKSGTYSFLTVGYISGRSVAAGLLAFASLAVVPVLVPSAHGASYSWQVASGDWSLASNWGGIVPTTGDTGYIVNGGTATITQPGLTGGTVALGGNSGSGTLVIAPGDGSMVYFLSEYIGNN